MRQEFPHRYAPNWSQIRRATLNATGGQCVLCRGRAKEAHHIRYAYWDGKKLKPIAGKERPLIDTFPLCQDHHKEAHRPHNWVWDKQNPGLGNHNRPEFVERLQASLQSAKKKPVLPTIDHLAPSWNNIFALFFRLLLD